MVKKIWWINQINCNPNRPFIPDYRILIIGGSVSGKANVLMNLIKHQWPDVDQILLCVIKPFQSKDQLLINESERKYEKKIQKHLLIIYKQLMISMKVWKTKIQQKKRQVLTVFDNMIADMGSSKEIKTQNFSCFRITNLLSKATV